MAIVSPSLTDGLTPGRSTTLTLDIPETVVIEPGIRTYRSGSDIAPSAIDGTYNPLVADNVKYWPSGCWTLLPVQYDIANIQESIVGLENVVRLSEWNVVSTQGATQLIPLLDEIAYFATSDLEGSEYGGNVPVTGDYFLKKQIPASGSCDPSVVAANSGFDASLPALPYPNTDIPMDRTAYTATTFRANQGFFLRWFVPYSVNTYNRNLFSFFFGQYSVVIGNGNATLWEYCQPSGGGASRWVTRDQWSTGPQGNQPGTAHCMGIFPHRSPVTGNNYLAFSDISVDNAPQINTEAILSHKSATVGTHVYTADASARNGDIDPSPGNVTSSAPIHVDIRRDLRMNLQVSLLTFPQTGGLLVDDPINVANFAFTGNTHGISANEITSANTVSTYTITGAILDADKYSATGSISNSAFVPGVGTYPQSAFAFNSTDGLDTPVLWGYVMSQQPLISSVTPGTFGVEGKSYNVECAAGDPQTESATVTGIMDVFGAYPKLAYRERFAGTLATTFTPAGTTTSQTVALATGVVTSNRAVRHGTGRVSMTGQDPQWNEYDLIMSGMWDRLSENVQPAFMRIYGIDQTVTNAIVPWKVTDAIVDILGACGFSSSQINIPSLQVRFWYGQSMKLEDTTINPTANLADQVVRMCRDYLGAYLHFEANAGTAGQWILIFGTQAQEDGTFVPVYNFTGSSHGHFAPPTSLNAYPANTVFYSTIEYVTKRPDANAITVLCGVPTSTNSTMKAIKQVAINPLSFAVPGMTTAPDPTSADYLGHWKPVTIVAPNLLVPDDSSALGYPKTQAAVNWTCRRYYDFLCHGQVIAKITAPLVFIQDPALLASASNGWRPLRFQDPVSLDGSNTWLIKSVQIAYSSDRTQMATYELIQPFPGQYFYGFDGKEEVRRQRRTGVTFSAGALSHTATHGQFAPSQHREQGMHELPVSWQSWSRFQNADGSFVPIPNWNVSTQTAG